MVILRSNWKVEFLNQTLIYYPKGKLRHCLIHWISLGKFLRVWKCDPFFYLISWSRYFLISCLFQWLFFPNIMLYGWVCDKKKKIEKPKYLHSCYVVKMRPKFRSVTSQGPEDSKNYYLASIVNKLWTSTTDRREAISLGSSTLFHSPL